MIDSQLLKDILTYQQDNPLLFNTGTFLLLFTGFLLLYRAVRRWHYVKLVVTILFSLYFYYKSSYIYCFILLGVCVSDYVLGIWMGHARRQWVRRLIVWLNVLSNVGMLVYFKYFNLIYETFANFTGTDFDALDIILPAGISFFTFRSISYIVDLYRRQMEPADNFLEYCFYLTFFPPLLAGPVVRAKDMMPQIKARPEVTRAMVAEGLFLIMAGLIKKVVVADYISGNFVDRVFENPALYSGVENLMANIGFTVQIYCDFSGYSDMAIGLALLLGYRFKDNFNSPFKAQSPTEFWHRWHISLSTWLRDYIYIPMGGNRKGKVRQHINLFSTFVVGGLWHGASWLYLIWGAYQGLLLSLHKIASSIFGRRDKSKPLPAWRISGNILITFILTVIGFTIFRLAMISYDSWDESLIRIADMGMAIRDNFHGEIIGQFVEAYAMIVGLILFALIIHFTPSSWTRKLKSAYTATPLILQAVILSLVLFLVIQSRQSDLAPFVYLQY